MTRDFEIDPEVKAFLPPHTPDERANLDRLIDESGHIDDLVVAFVRSQQRKILADGHTRLEIAERKGLDYHTRRIEVETRDDLFDWIADNQLGRRNITDERRSYYRGRKYRPKKDNGKNGHNVRLDENTTTKSKTAKELGDELGVNEKTVRRDADYADAVDSIAEFHGPEAKEEILSGRSGLSKKEVIEKAPKLCARCARLGVASCDPCREMVRRPVIVPAPSKEAVLRDDNGKVVPSHLVAIFQAGDLIAKAATSAERTAASLRDAEASAAFLILERLAKREAKQENRTHSWPMYSTHCKAAALRFHSFRPALVCPECLGGPTSEENDPCENCQDKGWLTNEEAKRDLH